MPQFATKQPSVKAAKDADVQWNQFRGGLNTLFKESEIKGNELSQADNLMLIGAGVPTKRFGTALYHMAGNATGGVRGISGFYQSDGTNQLLAVTDDGYLTKKSNASYTMITGVSWASGYPIRMQQLNNNMYLVNGQQPLVRYSNPTLMGFATVAAPSGLFATQVSGASGTFRYGYQVSALTATGETLATSEYVVSNQPEFVTAGSIKVTWTAPSAASGIVTGYNIWGRDPGSETFLSANDGSSVTFFDDGTATPSSAVFPPTSNSTGGIIAKYIQRWDDRLVYAGVSGEPSRIYISGKKPNHETFDISLGGVVVDVEPNSGDDITGLGKFGNRLVVFKQRSIWEITLTGAQVGNFFIYTPSTRLITASHGCIAPSSIRHVENDIFFLSRGGVYILGHDQNVAIDVLRTNELSAKIRPFFDNLTIAQKKNAAAAYINFKYLITFPGTGKTMAYDRERLAWMGPWSFDGNEFSLYYDSNDNEIWLYGDDTSSNVYQISSAFGDDNGTAFTTNLRTKKEDFGNWMDFKNIKTIDTRFRNVQGSVGVDIRTQTRDGSVINQKSFSITPTSGVAGWGADLWGDFQWGSSEQDGGASDINDIYRFVPLNKPARNIQYAIRTTARGDNYELLGIQTRATPMGRGFLSLGERV